MTRLKASSLLLLFTITFSAWSQSRYVLDRNNRLVGQLISNETRPALIRYVIGGPADTVLLEARPYELRETPPYAAIYFMSTTNCDANSVTSVWVGADNARLAQRYAVTINVFATSAQTTLTSSWLFVSPPFPTAVLQPSTAVATSILNPNRTCTAGPLNLGGTYLVQLNKLQNLRTTFVPPFWTP